MKLVIYCLVLFVLAGCSTLWPALSGNDINFAEKKIEEGVFYIMAEGPPKTSDEALIEALARKCAEVTIANGYQYYAPYIVGQPGVGTFANPESRKNIRIRRSTTIKLYAKEAAPPNATDAAAVLNK
ncbi:hypothetical protein [Bdellovibrio sp.]|uniref:hypothetical protein n=1 Tax=Bdellovibrio sp. TaxID=28201 RepID=UPI0032216EDA